MIYLGCGGSVQPVENFFVSKMHLGVHISTTTLLAAV
jgi:hypothetical protein